MKDERIESVGEAVYETVVSSAQRHRDEMLTYGRAVDVPELFKNVKPLEKISIKFDGTFSVRQRKLISCKIATLYGRKWAQLVLQLDKICDFIQQHQVQWFVPEISLDNPSTQATQTNKIKPSYSERPAPWHLVFLSTVTKSLLRKVSLAKSRDGKVLSDLIQRAEEVGMLAEIVASEAKNRVCGKLYAVNDEKVEEIERLAILARYFGKESTVDKKRAAKNSILLEDKKIDKFMRSLSLNFGMQRSIGSTDPEVIERYKSYIEANFMKTMPGFELYRDTVNRVNELGAFEADPFACRVHISRKGIVTKLGHRLYNEFCGFKKAGSENGRMKTREDYFEERWPGKKVYEYDVKSSIHRVNLFMSTGKWLDNKVDMYERIYGREFEPGERELFKKRFGNKLYFAKSENQFVRWFTNTIAKEKGIDNYRSAEIVDKAAVEFLKSLWRRLREVEGENLGPEVFYHEGAICALLHKRLLEAGYDVVQCYDGFYCDKPIEEFCEEFLPEVAKAWYNEIKK